MRADRVHLLRLLACVLVAVGAACLSPVDPDAAPVASVQLTFEDGAAMDTIPVRGTTRVRASAVARQGHVLGRDDFAFVSTDTTVAVVDAAGIVRGVRAGTTRIVATLPEGTRGEATIVVASAGVAYTIPVGSTPSALGFSTDYTRLYVLIAPDSLAIVDALGYFRIGAVRLGLPGHRVAATGNAVYVTHPDADSVTVLSAATSTPERRIWVGAGPSGVATTVTQAFIAARYDERVVIVENGRASVGVPVGGEPHDVVVSRDARRLFATVERRGAWRLVVIAPTFPDTIQSLPLSGRPTAITTDAVGDRVFVLLGEQGRVVAFAEQTNGTYREVGSAPVGANAGGLSVRPSGSPVIVSGEPVTIVDGANLSVIERVPGAGLGAVAVRPDGVFGFIASPSAGVLRVIGL